MRIDNSGLLSEAQLNGLDGAAVEERKSRVASADLQNSSNSEMLELQKKLDGIVDPSN